MENRPPSKHFLFFINNTPIHTDLHPPLQPHSDIHPPFDTPIYKSTMKPIHPPTYPDTLWHTNFDIPHIIFLIIIKVFIKHKTLSIEAILSAHKHTHRHPHFLSLSVTHAHTQLRTQI